MLASKYYIPLKFLDLKIENVNIERNSSIKSLRVILDEYIS